MASDVEPGASSTPTEPQSGSAVLESLTPEQRDEWRSKGTLPDTVPPIKADPAPAKPVEQAASTDAKPKAAPEPAKPHATAETRKAELDRDIQSRLQRRKDLDAEIAARETRLTQAETKPAAPSPAPAPVTDPNDPEPDPDKFADGQFDRAYLKAQARWETRQELREQQARFAVRQQITQEQHTVQARVKQFNERTTAAKVADPAFEGQLTDAVKALKPYSVMTREERAQAGPLNALADELIGLEHPEVALLHFSAHPEELDRFATMDVRTFLMEWGKLQPQFETGGTAKPAEPPPKTTTSAPAPPTLVGTRPAEPADAVEAAIARGDQRAYRDAMNRKEITAR